MKSGKKTERRSTGIKVLASSKNYVSFLLQRFGEELTDREMETQAYQYVIDPVAMKQLITGHMRWFWENHLQAEWIRTRPMLEASAKAFNQIELGRKSTGGAHPVCDRQGNSRVQEMGQ